MAGTNIIFLDIDGVLNRHVFNVEAASSSLLSECVWQFNRVLMATDARIVLSSAWRYMTHGGEMTLLGFDYLLRTHGVVHGRLIGLTRPDVKEGDDWEPRYRQIADWLRAPSVAINRYCILDDDPDAFGGRPGVQTAGGVGLTEADADAAIEILNATGNRSRVAGFNVVSR